MRGLAYVESPSLQPVREPAPIVNTPRNVMTPARRAALDALEIEFHDLLVQNILKAAAR